MIQRCTNPNNPAWDDYGGRGIRVCRRWQGPGGYKHFLADMGRKPSPGLTLERKDNNKGYYPWNCVWATRQAQGVNTRQFCHKLTWQNQTLSLRGWSEKRHIPLECLRARYKRGLPTAEILAAGRIAWTKRSSHSRQGHRTDLEL